MTHEELLDNVYFLKASLAAARAHKELSDTRLELAQADLKRQLVRVRQYRDFGRQWRELFTSEVTRLSEELTRVYQEAEACVRVLEQLAEEPSGEHVPSLVETVLGRRDWLARASQREREFAEAGFMDPIEVPEELLSNLKRMGMKFQGEKVPDSVEQSERKPAVVDMGEKPTLDSIIKNAGLAARKDGKPLEDPSPDTGTLPRFEVTSGFAGQFVKDVIPTPPGPPSQYPGDGTGASGAKGKA